MILKLQSVSEELEEKLDTHATEIISNLETLNFLLKSLSEIDFNYELLSKDKVAFLNYCLPKVYYCGFNLFEHFYSMSDLLSAIKESAN